MPILNKIDLRKTKNFADFDYFSLARQYGMFTYNYKTERLDFIKNNNDFFKINDALPCVYFLSIVRIGLDFPILLKEKKLKYNYLKNGKVGLREGTKQNIFPIKGRINDYKRYKGPKGTTSLHDTLKYLNTQSNDDNIYVCFMHIINYDLIKNHKDFKHINNNSCFSDLLEWTLKSYWRDWTIKQYGKEIKGPLENER